MNTHQPRGQQREEQWQQAEMGREQAEAHRYLNNRAENTYQPTRQRERRMQGFKSPGQAQRFLAA